MTRISAIGIALLCILCVTSCGLKSRQTTTESSSETGYSPVTTDTAATIVPCYAKGYTVKYLPHHVRLVDIHDPQKRKQQHFPLCAGTERHKACRHTERLYGD